MAEMDKITIEVEANTTDAINGLKSLKKTLNKLKDATEGLKGIDAEGVGRIHTLAGAVDSLVQATTSGDFETTIRNLRRLTHLDFSNLTGIDGTISRLSELLGRTGNQPQNQPPVPQTPPEQPVPQSNEVEQATGRWERLRDVLRGELPYAGKAAGNILKWIADRVLVVGQNCLKAAGNVAKFALQNNALTKFAKSVGDASAGLKGFLGKIAGMVKTRMLRKMISAVTEGIKEGIQNLYRWSNAMGGSFAKSMDQGYTALSYFKNSIGAAVAPLISSFIPILDAAIDKIVSFVNAINQLFAKLSGASVWTKAVKQSRAYSETLSDASGSAKQLNETLADFDEINLIASESGGSGGSGKNNPNYGGMFEEVKEFDPETEDFFNRIRDAFQGGRWSELGAILAEGFNGLVDNIQWENIGDRIGGKITAVVETLASFLKLSDFTKLGNKFSLLLTRTIRRIDFSAIGTILVRKFTSKIDFLLGALSNQELWTEVGTALGDLFKGTFNEAGEWIGGIDWGTVATDAVTGLESVFERADVDGITGSLGTLISKALNGISDVLGTDVLERLSKDLGTWISDAIRGVDWKELGYALEELGMKFIAHAGPVLMDLFGAILDVLASIMDEAGLGSAGDWLREQKDSIYSASDDLLKNTTESMFGKRYQSLTAQYGLDSRFATPRDFAFKYMFGDMDEATANYLTRLYNTRSEWDQTYLSANQVTPAMLAAMATNTPDYSNSPYVQPPTQWSYQSEADLALQQAIDAKLAEQNKLMQEQVTATKALAERPVAVNVSPSAGWGVHGAASSFKKDKLFGSNP